MLSWLSYVVICFHSILSQLNVRTGSFYFQNRLNVIHALLSLLDTFRSFRFIFGSSCPGFFWRRSQEAVAARRNGCMPGTDVSAVRAFEISKFITVPQRSECRNSIVWNASTASISYLAMDDPLYHFEVLCWDSCSHFRTPWNLPFWKIVILLNFA